MISLENTERALMKKGSHKRKTRRKNHYFTQVHEDAIIAYTKTTSDMERTKLYANFIRPAFSEMVDKITYTYKFTTLPNVDSLREECKIWLTTILDKYDPSKGSKAFSYFSVITKNWFIHKVKKTSAKLKREISLDSLDYISQKKYLHTEHKYEKKREQHEFWENLLKEINDWEGCEMQSGIKPNDLYVLKAIKELLQNPEDVEILNKKAIYLYLREITGLNTKQIANSLKKFKVKYRVFRDVWNRGDI